MPRALRRDLKSLRTIPQPRPFTRRPEPIRRPAPEPATVVTDQISLCFPDGPPLSPLGFLGYNEMFTTEPMEFETVGNASDWALRDFPEDQSAQTGANFWPLFD
jgi:hypothetical protein